MRNVNWLVAPVVLGVLLCQTASEAAPAKSTDPASIKAEKARLFAARVKPGPAVDPTNQPPPGGAILDLNGLAIPHGTYHQYTVNFVATLASTAITFAFREDPAFISFEAASVIDQTVSGPNLLVNGSFTGGTYTNNGNSGTPLSWTYANVYGASAGGSVSTCVAGGPTGSNACWYDGAVQAYDAISQTIATTIGHTYQISFYMTDSSGLSTFSRVSTNGDVSDTGGNGVDVLAYALAGLPAAGGAPTAPIGTPAPTALLLTMIGLACVCLFLGYRRLRMPGRNA